MSRRGRDSLVRLYGRSPERGAHVDDFVRPRWAVWLRTQLEEYGISPDELAQALAGDPDDKQSWPRDRVRRWLRGEITVSVAGAFETGAALARLGAHTCGPEALFASGHLAAFIALLEYIGDEDGLSAIDLGDVAILPFVAYAYSLDKLAVLDDQKLEKHSRAALLVLRRAQWAHEAFDRAFERFSERSETRGPAAELAFALRQGALATAYQIAATLTELGDLVAPAAFPFVADWVAAMGGWREGLETFATSYERLNARRRSRFRQKLIQRKHTG